MPCETVCHSARPILIQATQHPPSPNQLCQYTPYGLASDTRSRTAGHHVWQKQQCAAASALVASVRVRGSNAERPKALPPALAFTALAVTLSVATRSSIAGIGLPVLAGLTMQLYAFVDGPEVVRRLLVTSAFGAWHGLLVEPPYYRPLVHGTIVSGAYVVVCLALAYRTLRRRDIGG